MAEPEKSRTGSRGHGAPPRGVAWVQNRTGLLFTLAVVIMIVFTMMAVGLNMVVGYAGLLDLGYVAFFALGAYTLGWFGSGLFNDRNVHWSNCCEANHAATYAPAA